MEQHPVPRNISSFQFRLVGDMTLKQFAYLAGGAVTAFFIVKFFPVPGILKWPAALFFAFGGLAFAFLPIQERPLDKWLVAFIRSINSPTQYVWHKDTIIPDILVRNFTTTTKTLPQSHQTLHADAKKKLEMYLTSLPKTPHQTINIREKNYMDRTLQLFSTVGGGTTSFAPIIEPQRSASITTRTSPIVMPTNTTRMSVISEKKDEKNVGSEEKMSTINKLQEPMQTKTEVKPSTNEIKTAPATQDTSKILSNPDIVKSQENVAVPQNQPSAQTPKKEDTGKLNEVIKEKEKLEAELNKLKEELTKSQAPIAHEEAHVVKPQMQVERKEPTIKTITPKTAVNEIGIPKLPQVPNLIMGVIKDMQGKFLPNIILTIKDTKGVPHRALKTNRLGQFSTATPLQNGIYHIEAEDPLKRYVFDIAEINLEGKVFLPIEIDAKGEKELIREKLTKEIFGNQAAA